MQRVELVLRSQSTNSDARRWLAALSILAGTSPTQLVGAGDISDRHVDHVMGAIGNHPLSEYRNLTLRAVIGSCVKRWRNSVHATPPMP